MSLSCSLLSFGIHYVTDIAADSALAKVESYLTDHGSLLVKALVKANDRAWTAVGLALAAPSLKTWAKGVWQSADVRGVAKQVREFLETAPTGLEHASDHLRTLAAKEWQQLKEQKRFVGDALSNALLATRSRSLRAHGTPAKLLALAHETVQETAAELERDAPHLAKVLTLASEGEPPLLTAAFTFFLRREIATHEELFREMAFDSAKLISERQQQSFQLLDDRTAGILDQIDVLFVVIGDEFKTQGAKLDDILATLNALMQRGHVVTDNTRLSELDPLRHAADRGDAEAMYNIGEKYYYGREVTQDYARALTWYHKAADLGDADAMDNIGYMHEHGYGVPKDWKQAKSWFKKAADLGQADAKKKLGWFGWLK